MRHARLGDKFARRSLVCARVESLAPIKSATEALGWISLMELHECRNPRCFDLGGRVTYACP
jgi:predicted RNA polymerase sigma factor